MLTAKSAPVTGSASAIALGIAEHLAALGCDIVLNRFGDPSAIRELRLRLAGAHGVAVRNDPADASDTAAIETMMTGSIGESGAIDILITNAATEDANGTR
jgi:NAD(P)-dependent dehydrogenase (short-subunit alcohol dehydrogenase family)